MHREAPFLCVVRAYGKDLPIYMAEREAQSVATLWQTLISEQVSNRVMDLIVVNGWCQKCRSIGDHLISSWYMGLFSADTVNNMYELELYR